MSRIWRKEEKEVETPCCPGRRPDGERVCPSEHQCEALWALGPVDGDHVLTVCQVLGAHSRGDPGWEVRREVRSALSLELCSDRKWGLWLCLV